MSDKAIMAGIRARAMSQAAVKANLGDPARFYDDPPPDAVFPYVTLGRVEARPSESSESQTLEHSVTLHVWSRYGGRAEALDVIAALRAALHNAPLEIAERRLVLALVTFTDIFRSGDGRTTHGVLRLRVISEPED